MKLPENHFLASRKTIILLLILVISAGLFYNLGANNLRAEEPRRATISMEMIFSGNYIHPTLNNWSYYNKPPLFNWTQVAAMKVFNTKAEWVARVPSLFSHIICCVLIYFSFRVYIGKKTALLTAILSLIAVELLFYGSVFSGEIDLFFSLLVFLQIMSLFIFYQRKKWLYLFLASYFFAALGVLTKGPPSIAFQGLTLIAMAVLYKDLRLLFRWQHFVGVALFLLISGGYFYVYNTDGDAVAYLVRLFKEASQRTGLETELSKTILGIINVPLQILLLILPSTLLIPYLFKRGNLKTIKTNPLLSFSLYFVLFNLPLYWLTGDFKNRYVYMFFPFLILFFAYFFESRKLEMPKITALLEKIYAGLMVIFPFAFIIFIFIPIAELVNHAVVISIVFAILFGALALYYFSLKQHKYILFLVAVCLLRVSFNFIYPDLLQAKSRYNIKSEINKVLQIANGRNIQFFGTPRVVVSDASIGPLKLSEISTAVAPHMSYQISYYYSLAKNETLAFTTEMLPNRLYLVRESHLGEHDYKIIYRFTDTDKQSMILIEG